MVVTIWLLDFFTGNQMVTWIADNKSGNWMVQRYLLLVHRYLITNQLQDLLSAIQVTIQL